MTNITQESTEPSDPAQNSSDQANNQFLQDLLQFVEKLNQVKTPKQLLEVATVIVNNNLHLDYGPDNSESEEEVGEEGGKESGEESRTEVGGEGDEYFAQFVYQKYQESIQRYNEERKRCCRDNCRRKIANLRLRRSKS